MSTSLPALPVVLNGKTRTIRSADVPCGTVTLRAIVAEDVPLLWKWLNEYPHQNFEDGGPKTLEEFEAEVVRRMQRGIYFTIVLHNDAPVGCIGYEQQAPTRGKFRGICFAKSVHRTGVAAFAVKHFIKSMFNVGTEKISAEFYSNNEQIKHFLKKQGFVLEGTLTAHAYRRGVPTKMSLVALHKRFFTEKVN